jgi:hypothetical protein
MTLMGVSPAGWYPDPSGTGGQRYFDGKRWTNQQRAKSRTKTAWTTFWVMSGTAVFALAFWAVAIRGGGSAGSSSFDQSHAASDAVDTCQAAVQKMLKDPGSATFDGWTASPATGSPSGLLYNPSAGDEYYTASGMVNAKNGFGGYGGDEQYSCDAVVTGSTVRAQAHAG